MKHLLTIAGSDSSGGAGIQADLKTFSALGTYGMSVITAITAQNTRGVIAALTLSVGLVEAQIDAIFLDIRVDAVKIGMLGCAELASAVAARLRRWAPPLVVLDPVMVSKSGHRLLDPEAEEVLLRELVPLATLVTPNIPEAETLTGLAVSNIETMRIAAERLVDLGARAVLVKGGHLADEATDLLLEGGRLHQLPGARLDAAHTHGTGCSLSSAIAVFLAKGETLPSAARRAKDWVARGIAEGLAVGGGCGPIHHFHEFYDAEGRRR